MNDLTKLLVVDDDTEDFERLRDIIRQKRDVSKRLLTGNGRVKFLSKVGMHATSLQETVLGLNSLSNWPGAAS